MKSFHFALLGGDVSYSRSPDIFRAVFNELGREGRFDLCPTQPERLEAAVKNLVTSGVTGFSVTIPHKQTIIQYLNSADELVHATGAVNSVAVRDGSLHGYNTDCCGFAFALKQAEFDGCEQALVLGAGGAAGAVAHTLSVDFGVRNFVLCGRNVERLSNLKNILSARSQHIMTQIVMVSKYADQCPSDNRLVVNCTPLGGPLFPDISPIPPGLDWSTVGLYFDLNYNPDNSAVMLAKEAGVKAVDGSSMLVAQALKSMELWTGLHVDYDNVYRQVFPHPNATQSREV